MNSLEPRVEEAINSVEDQRFINRQLILLSEEYNNFKTKANDKFCELLEVIKKQRENEKQMNVQRGMTPYMATLMSVSTTGDMNLYNKVAKDFPNCKTPTNSGISTPSPTSE